MQPIALWVLLTCTNVGAIIISEEDQSKLSEGRYCDLTVGGVGTCETKENCVGGTTAQGEECSSPLVCCPLPGVKSRQKCEEYSRIERSNCPKGDNFKAEPMEFPHMAALGFNSIINNKWLCGGILISERYILTTARCLTLKFGPPRRVRLGDLEQADREVVNVQQVTIEEVIPHPNYKPPIIQNNIALLKLARDVTFSSHVRPACLYTASEMSVSSGVALGWGSTTEGDASSNLMKVKLPFVSSKACAAAYENEISPTLGGINVSSLMCAGDRGGDTCQGDSGGPLQISRSGPGCMVDVVGVRSFGVFCGTGIPSVYTVVSYFVPWIESIVWP